MNTLKLNKQLCFPVYSLNKELTNKYRPLLAKLDLTYPQYLVMLVLWEENNQNVSDIGKKLHLDSGTLTPLLKRLQSKGLIQRIRNIKDERVVDIKLTLAGETLNKRAKNIPHELLQTSNLCIEDLKELKRIIEKIFKTKEL